MRIAVVTLAAMLAVPTNFAAAADRILDIDGAVPIFCRDSTGAFQPFVRSNYAALKEGFVKQFGWNSVLLSKSATLGSLVFSQNGHAGDRETISYDVQPHSGGIALLHMHVRLQGKREDLSGTPMCMQTFGIMNID